MLPVFLTKGENPHLNTSNNNQRRFSIVSKNFDNEYHNQQQIQVIDSELSQPLPNADGSTSRRRLTQIISIVENSEENVIKPKGRYLLLFIVEPILTGCFLFPILVLFWDCGWNLTVTMINSLNNYPLAYNLDKGNYTSEDYGDYSPQSLIVPYVIVEILLLILYLCQDLLYDFLKRQHTVVGMILLKIHTLLLASFYIVQWEMIWTILDQYTPTDWTFLMVLSLASLFALTVLTGTLSDMVCSPFVVSYDSIDHCIQFECPLVTAQMDRWKINLMNFILYEFIISNITIIGWHGFYVILDQYLYPDDTTMSAWICLLIGYPLYFPLMYCQYYFEKFNLKYELWAVFSENFPQFHRNIIHALAFASCLFVWRGFWVLYDTYLRIFEIYYETYLLISLLSFGFLSIIQTFSSMNGPLKTIEDNFRCLNHRLSSLIIFVKRSVAIQSNFDLGKQMKLLNDNKQFKKSLELFDKHKKNNIETFSSLIITQALKACAHLEDFQRAETIYHLISSRIKDDLYILASLIHLYMQCGDVARAESLFDTATTKTLSMYGAMMKGYIKNNQANKAIDLFNEIKNPNEVIIMVLFNACAQLGTIEALNLTKKVSKEIPKSFHLNPRLITSLLDALMQLGHVVDAHLLFSRSQNKVLPMYGAMMKGYIKNNMANKTIDLFNEIKHPDEIVTILLFNACAQLRTPQALELAKTVSKKMPECFYSNIRIPTSLFNALIKCGDCSSAEILFVKMRKSVEAYGNLMNGFNHDNNPSKTLDLFNQMKHNGINANIIIYLCVIKALSQIGDYELCQSIVKEIPHCFLVDHKIQSALIDMWGKTGSVDQAKQIFEKILEPNHIGYTAMINCYGLNGMGIQSIELYRKMPQQLIDEVAYVSVLNACSHSGLVDEARSIFRNIEIKTESIYATMIDCLSRAYCFREAQELIEEYERLNSPVIVMYMALLSGARNEKNSDLSQNIYDRMKNLFPQMTNPLISAAVLLANVYASSGDIDKASDIRIQLNKSGLKKKIGLTWTVTNGEIYQFRAHDQSHPRSDEIYVELEKISKELTQHGHEYDSSWITRSLNQDETVASVLCGHSEKLAIAWNFVANPNTTRIQLTKNLRVCGDCHRATKLIAAIRQCEIIVRDANRIHHFYTNGQCSCSDYF
ncbi:unnamed protein product [Rotaria magnacalcarata]